MGFFTFESHKLYSLLEFNFAGEGVVVVSLAELTMRTSPELVAVFPAVQQLGLGKQVSLIEGQEEWQQQDYDYIP